MASKQDIQDLLRLLTTGRNKLNMLAAMGRVKALQAADLGSISAIAAADVAAIETAIGDAKAAKQLHIAAKNSSGDDSSKKRSSDAQTTSAAKRSKSAYILSDEPQSPAAIEASLALPEPIRDGDELAGTVLLTNRAPLVLAFAVMLLKYTMPEQPPSSKLSLAQAVVSMNSQSKAANIGVTQGATAEQEGWGLGQPKVKIMGREVYVLKRSGYEWKPQVESTSTVTNVEGPQGPEEAADTVDTTTQSTPDHGPPAPSSPQWHVSQSISFKSSTFIARSISIASPSDARSIVANLMKIHPSIESATHNIIVWRSRLPSGIIVEDSQSDGETGGGPHILQLLQRDNIVDVLVVCSRWWGGIMLGPDRWRIMTDVVNDALSQRGRIVGSLDAKEPLWGLDLDGMRRENAPVAGGVTAGMPVHQPTGARDYLLKSFATAEGHGDGQRKPETSKKKTTAAALRNEKETNLARLLGALESLFDSWMPYLTTAELDRRAWGWYMNVRPHVEDGIKGWGAKGEVKLADILKLRRKGD